jgi:hypothetical protein
MTALMKMTHHEIDNSLRNNPYTARVLHTYEQHQDNLDVLDEKLAQLDTRFGQERSSLLGTRPVKDGDTHIQHRFNPSASGADKDIQQLHQIEVGQTLLNSLDGSEERFYQKMSAAIQGQKMFGAGPTMASQLGRMRESSLADDKPKERITINTF